jgi:hypothetical protein
MTGACLAVMDCLGWHPASQPVVTAGVSALSALATMSSELCSILVQSKASAFVRRALSRSIRTFDGDVTLAVVAINTVATFAETFPESVVNDGTALAVLESCRQHADEVVDEQVVRFLALIVCTTNGKEVLSRGGENGDLYPLHIIAELMQRCQFSPATLRHACSLLIELVTNAPRGITNALCNSELIDSILLALKLSGDASPREQAVGLASDALDLLRRMTRLGADVCGTIVMAGCIQEITDAVRSHRTSRDVAMRVAMLIEALARSRLGGQALLEQVHDCLTELIDMWTNEPFVTEAAQRAFNALQRREIGVSMDGLSQASSTHSQDDLRHGSSSGHSSGSQDSSPDYRPRRNRRGKH